MSTITDRAPWVVGGFILGLALGGAWHLGYFTLPAMPETATTTVKSWLPPESGDIDVGNQVAGSSVTITSVTVPPPGVWVAIQEVNEDNTLGNILGAARVHQPSSNIHVSLLRSTIAGQRYAAALYRDNGDNVFDTASDSAYIDFDTGARVIELFTTSSN